jgi:predicted HicB family RNase H-like nuclease
MPTTLPPAARTALEPLTSEEICGSLPRLPPLPPVQNPVTDVAAHDVLSIARQLEAQEPGWITFFREVFGVEGLVRRLFPAAAELEAFQQGDTYRELLKILGRLRAKKPHDESRVECQRVITLRIPKSLHLSLLREAYELNTSMNQLSITRLLKLDDTEAA